MTDITAQPLAIPLALSVGHILLLAIALVMRRARGGDTALFTAYLLVSLIWLLSSLQQGLEVLLPYLPWASIAAYASIVLGFLLWGFTRAFLHRPVGRISWLPALVALLVLALIQMDLLTVPPFSVSIGPAILTQEGIANLISYGTTAAFAAAAVLTALVEYIRRPSPLHRNRILYWLLGTAPLIAGLVLILALQQETTEFIGASTHLAGATLLTYILVQPQLPNIGTGVRRATSYLLTATLTVSVTVALSLVAVHLLSISALVPLQIDANLLLGLTIAGVIVFVLYQPVSGLARSVLDRLIFGRGYRTQLVVREYSQAITQILVLDELSDKAMQILDQALRIERGTILVVDDAHEEGWSLRVLTGLNVSPDQPPILIPAATPLADWLVQQGAALLQYTLDVDPRFSDLDSDHRSQWQQLDMEVFVPIKRSGQLIGLLALGLRRSGQPYGDRELELLATLADQTAVALENASLFDRVQRRAEQLALLNEIGRGITASLDLDQAIDMLSLQIQGAFSRETGRIFLWNADQGSLILKSAFGRAVLGPESPSESQPELQATGAEKSAFRVEPGQGLVGWVSTEKEPLLLMDPASDARYDLGLDGALIPGAQSVICVPTIAKEKTTGVMMIASERQSGLGSAELDLLESIASFASIAIENARQVMEREANLRRQVERLEIQIDEMKRAKEVSEITDTAQFRSLQDQARQLRRERASAATKGLFDKLQEEVEKRTDDEEPENTETDERQDQDTDQI
jgi:GAF domain-containing protein